MGNYMRQNGTSRSKAEPAWLAEAADVNTLTPRQRRRLSHKSAREQFGNTGGGRLKKRHEKMETQRIKKVARQMVELMRSTRR
jgi:hypothetical protein